MSLVFSFRWNFFPQISICVFVYSQVQSFVLVLFFTQPELKLGTNLIHKYIIYIYIYIYIYVCVCVCVCVYIYIYIYVHVSGKIYVVPNFRSVVCPMCLASLKSSDRTKQSVDDNIYVYIYISFKKKTKPVTLGL